MSYLLDTNVCIRLVRRRSDQGLLLRIAALPQDAVFICSVVLMELVYGALHSDQPEAGMAAVDKLASVIPSLPFDDVAAAEAGRIRNNLAAAGTPIGPADLMIAGIAAVNRMTLVTNNTREYARVKGLVVEDWQGLQ